MRRPTLRSHFIPALTIATLLVAACGEKASTAPAGTGTKGTASEKDDDDDDSGTDTGTGTNKKKKPSGGTTGSTAGTGTGTEDPGSLGSDDPSTKTTFDLCKALKAESALQPAAELVTKLCDGLDGYRTGAYKGGASTTVKLKWTGFKVDIDGASAITSDAKKYFDIMRQQVSAPKAFQDKGYKRDEKVTIEKEVTTGDVVTFEYTRDPPDGGDIAATVNYKGKSTFVTMGDGAAFAQITESSCPCDVIESLKGLVVVEKTETGAFTYSLSIQTYTEDTSNEATIKSQTEATMKKEQSNMFENSKL